MRALTATMIKNPLRVYLGRIHYLVCGLRLWMLRRLENAYSPGESHQHYTLLPPQDSHNPVFGYGQETITPELLKDNPKHHADKCRLNYL